MAVCWGMRVFFLRHAHALDDPNDAIRPLSDRGRKQCREVGKFLRKASIRFDRAYSSPLLRATQTTEEVLKAMGPGRKPRLEEVDVLLNESALFPGWLARLPDVDTVLLVGHAPSLPEHLARLIALPDPGRVNLPKAGLACVETEDRRTGILKLFVSPKLGMA